MRDNPSTMTDVMIYSGYLMKLYFVNVCHVVFLFGLNKKMQKKMKVIFPKMENWILDQGKKLLT